MTLQSTRIGANTQVNTENKNTVHKVNNVTSNAVSKELAIQERNSQRTNWNTAAVFIISLEHNRKLLGSLKSITEKSFMNESDSTVELCGMEFKLSMVPILHGGRESNIE